MPPGGRGLLRALYRGAGLVGIDARVMQAYQPRHGAVLVTYGMGGDDRLPAARAHLAAGGRLIAWDAGYWHRKLSEMQRCYRVSIDGFHPPQFVMKGAHPGAQRWKESGLQQVSGGNPAGPILLAGNAPKSIAIGARGWTAAQAADIRAAFPGSQISYRPKPKKPAERDVEYDLLSTCATAQALDEASLVVCRHSNIAVDACLAGVPVVCEDGAAAAIYPCDLRRADEQPSAEVRTEFLHRLAWWQWSPAECAAGDPWPFLLRMLDEPV